MTQAALSPIPLPVDIPTDDEGPCSHLLPMSDRQCGQPGRKVSAMCVHEHVRSGYQCPMHRARRDAKACCLVCHQLGHVCRLWFSS